MSLRWQDVKALVLQGLTDVEIAARLNYSYGYIAQMRKSIELKPNRKKCNGNPQP